MPAIILTALNIIKGVLCLSNLAIEIFKNKKIKLNR